MPGFRYCQWCNGKGCIACDAEQKKWTENALAKAPKWREPDVRDIRDATIEAELLRQYVSGDAVPPEAVEAAFKPALDAEYARQFPDGPQPIFTARRDNPGDMELLKKVFHRTVLEEAFGTDGEGVAEIERRAAEARGIQALRWLANPTQEEAP